MILVASPIGLLHPHPFCNSRISRNLYRKSLRNVEIMVLSIFKSRGCSSCRSGGVFHGIQIRCAQASSEETKGKGFSYSKALRKFTLCFTLAASFLMTQPCLEPVYAIQSVSAVQDFSQLMSGPPIEDTGALLRYALPIDNKPIKDIQKNLENIKENLKAPGMKGLNSAGKNIEQATLVLNKYKTEILGDIAESKKGIGKELVDNLLLGLQDFKTIVADKDRDAIASKQKELLDIVGQRFGTWPVGMLQHSKSKAILEGPVCNRSQVIGWHTNEKSRRFRRFHVDMSGFAFNSTILWDPRRWHRLALERIRQLDTVKEGFQETTFIEQLVEDESQMEGLLNDCAKIMVWHLHLEAPEIAYPPRWLLEKKLDVVVPLRK